jgi:hypothetical protein
LNSAAPSGGFGAGVVICAMAWSATSIAMQQASPIDSAARRFVIYITVGAAGA